MFVAGYLEIGTVTAPYSRSARIALTNYELPVARIDDGVPASILEQPYGKKVIIVYGSGIWSAHAVGRTPTWTQVSASISAGDTSLTVSVPVDWKVGDEILITSTDFNGEQSERRRIQSITGQTITFNEPLVFGHFGEILNYAGTAVDMRAEVAVLTSNVKIYGDMINSVNWTSAQEPAYDGMDEWMQFGGHTAYIQNATVNLEGLEFFNMGQGGRLGRYPVHWHLMGDVTGQYIKRSSLHDLFARCVTIHSSNYLLIQDTVCYDTYGHMYYQEDGDEYYTSFIRNLAVKTRPVGRSSSDQVTGSYKYAGCADHPPGLRLQFMDYVPSGFWITNTNVTMIGNVAVNHDFGFWIRVEPMFAEPDYKAGCQVCAPTCGQVPQHMFTFNSNGMIFKDNVAHSNDVGWWVKENWQPNERQELGPFLVYKNSVGGTPSSLFLLTDSSRKLRTVQDCLEWNHCC